MNSILKYIIGLTLILNSGLMNAQSLWFSGGVGYGSYSMNSVKDLHTNLEYASWNGLKTVAYFPPYYSWFGGVEGEFDNFSVGFILNKQTTGARSTYSDYSGRIDLDELVSELSVGLTYKKHLLKNTSTHNLSIGGEAYIGFNELKIMENIQVYEETRNQEILATSTGVSILPNISYYYNYKFLRIGILAGYSIGVYSTPFEYHNTTIKSGSDEVKPSWNGYRLRLSISFNPMFFTDY